MSDEAIIEYLDELIDEVEEQIQIKDSYWRSFFTAEELQKIALFLRKERDGVEE